MTAATSLPTHEVQLHELVLAEQREGWLSVCMDAGRYLPPNRQLVDALSAFLGSLAAGPIVEVCAGSGELAEELAATGLAIVATDAAAPAVSLVVRATAAEALRRYRPTVVLGSFVPHDAIVDEAVMSFPSVQHYVVLNARVGGMLGCGALWNTPGWTGKFCPRISRWMLTRHDVWMATDDRSILQHGEAWHFRRSTGSGSKMP